MVRKTKKFKLARAKTRAPETHELSQPPRKQVGNQHYVLSEQDSQTRQVTKTDTLKTVFIMILLLAIQYVVFTQANELQQFFQR